MINFEPFHKYLANPRFVHALHIPGLELTQDKTEIAGITLRRLDWVEWMVLEHGATAEALIQEFEDGLHSFALIDRKDFAGDAEAAEALASCDIAALRHIVSALRLVKTGCLLDPEESMRYERRGSLNSRTPGLFGRQLFEPKYSRTYVLNKVDADAAEAIAADLAHPTVCGDRTIQLAIRHFDASYGHAISVEEQLLHLFTSLEATFAEYKAHARPVPGASLGKCAAILWPTADRRKIASFLDEKSQARGLRNAIAHGNVGSMSSAHVNADIELLREILRQGLRMLLKLASQQSRLLTVLDSVSTGLSALPPKAAFQHILGHAVRESLAAQQLLTDLSS